MTGLGFPEGQIESRAGILGIDRQRGLEGGLGGRRHLALGRGGQGLALERGKDGGDRLMGGLEQGNGFAIGRRGLGIAAELAFGSRQQGPALRILRMSLHRGFELGRRRRHLLIACRCRRGRAIGEGKGGKIGRADIEVDRHGRRRQQQEEQAGAEPGPRGAAASAAFRGDSRWARGGQQPALDLEPRRGGLGLRQQAARHLALELGQLVAIDGEIGMIHAHRRAPAEQRQGQQRDHAQAEQGGQNPEQDHPWPGSRPPAGASAFSAISSARRLRSASFSGSGARSCRRRSRA